MAGFAHTLAYRLATSDAVERAARALPPIERACYRRARRYVAGETLEDALATARDLAARGLGSTIDFFGESLSDRAAVESVVDTYAEAASRIQGLGDGAYLEVVPSHVGVDISPGFFREQLGRIVEALPPGSRLEVSAEESWRTERVLPVVLALAEEGAPLMLTLQANLRRTESDARRVVDAGIPMRLVKGAYLESRDVAHPWGEATDRAFRRLARQVHDSGGQLAIATHDPQLRDSLLSTLDGVTVEMLLGVRADDALRLAAAGHSVRIYVPFGTRWFRYWMRRRVEAARS